MNKGYLTLAATVAIAIAVFSFKAYAGRDDIQGRDIAPASITSTNVVGKTAIVNSSIDSDKIQDGSVIIVDLANGSVDSNKIVDGSVILADLASGSVDSNKIIDGTIYNAEIAASAAIDTAKISGVFPAAMIGSLDTSKIGSGAFTADRIGSGVIDTTKLNVITVPATGTLLCYTGDGKIGVVSAVIDTGKTGTCSGF